MFFLTLAGRLVKPKLVNLPFLSLFRFGLKFASQLASLLRSYLGYFGGRFLAYFGDFQRSFFLISQSTSHHITSHITSLATSHHIA